MSDSQRNILGPKFSMESPQLSQEIRNSEQSINKYRLAVSDGNMCAHFCVSPKTVQNTVVSPKEGKESSFKGSSSRKEEDNIHSTPLRVVRVRRQSLHSIDLNPSSHGTAKTPLTNGKKTPVRVPANPFDAVLMDRLHLPICSPSIFTKIPEYEEKEFEWDIEQQATLFPAPIEEELHVHHHVHEHYDAEMESKIQDAIDRFYEGRIIAPSPWIAAKKCGLVRGLAEFTSEDESDLSPRTHKLENMPEGECRKETNSSLTTQDACTQTLLSLPFHLPPELMCALQKYTLPPDGDSGSASSSMVVLESESLSTSTRRKLFNAEDMSISQADSTHVISPRSPVHNASMLPKAAASSPIKGGTILADFHYSDDIDEDEIHTGVLESSQTTFWKATSSPTISPITSQRLPPYPRCSPQDGMRLKKKFDLHSQYTPPSSRTRQRPLFPYSFAPLLEKDEDDDNDKLKEDVHDEKAQNYAEAFPGNKTKELGSNVNSSVREIQNFGGSKYTSGIPGFPSTASLQNITDIPQTHKDSTMSISQYQQQVSQGAYERLDSLGVDDTCTSHMQDTGYQTVSMTTLPGSSLSSNSLKPRGCNMMPVDSGSLVDKITSCPIKICEDGYMSLSFNKVPLVSIYNDESMTDVWHSSPPPLASSTPAKNFGGFLM